MSFTQEEIKACFNQIDTDCSGFICKKELAVAFQKLGVPAGAECDELLKQFMEEDDKDMDGKISFDEFKDGLLAK